MQIIGLSGTKRSGKDTVCRLMQEITRKGRLKHLLTTSSRRLLRC